MKDPLHPYRYKVNNDIHWLFRGRVYTAALCLLLVNILTCQRPEPLKGDVLITNVNVIDVERGVVVSSQQVLLRGDTIHAILDADQDRPLEATTVIEGEGRYLMPGLWDMHVHNTGDELMRTAFLPLYIAHGITGIREMSGLPEDFLMKDSVDQELLVGPTIVMGSPLVDGLSTWNVGDHHLTIPDEAAARAIVDTIKAQGYDFVKTYSFLSRDNYLAIMQRARELDIEVNGHIPNEVSAFEAIEAGHRTIEHMIGLELSAASNEGELRERLQQRIRAIQPDSPADVSRETFLAIEYEPVPHVDPAKEDSLFALLADRDTWVVPTLVLQRIISYPEDEQFWDDDFQRYIDIHNRDTLLERDYQARGRLKPTIDYRMRSLKRLHDRGGKILAGSDMNGGIPLHVELQLMVESGLTPAAALRTATLNPAEYLGHTAETGTVEAGKRANLVLLEENPLDDIRNTLTIAAVINRGRVYDRAQLDALKSRAVAVLDRVEAQVLAENGE
ncbi:hypothetical protein CGL56_17045 [Neolewinella marina]|uniref:Amidohydrolase-related domain-containing protein n=1 Tax=Neolewinella marina TaxID=438751 RepID=A0A2G0CBF5_9BACT|nr:hypothetical protein CGL56_17045 [Neolewinella marina]